MCVVPSLSSVVLCNRVAWVCLLLCKEEGSSPVSVITERRDMGMYEVRLQTTQPTSGRAVTADTSCCANCVEPPSQSRSDNIKQTSLDL